MWDIPKGLLYINSKQSPNWAMNSLYFIFFSIAVLTARIKTKFLLATVYGLSIQVLFML